MESHCAVLHLLLVRFPHLAAGCLPLTLVRIFIAYFVIAFQSGICSPLTTYAYADFQASNLVSVSSVMASIIGGVLRLPIAKVLDIWGRAEGLMVMIFVQTLGLILYATADSVAHYSAAAVIYGVGYTGVYHILGVFISDTSQLVNRGLMLAISQLPFICTSFTAPLAVQSILKDASWRWGFGSFAIATPITLLPLALVFLYYQRKAVQNGVMKREPSGRTFTQTFKHYFIEFDGIGLFILAAGFVLFLLPFSIASSTKGGWSSATIIVMLVIGFLLLCSFPVWEKYGARKQILPWWLLKDRTIICCALTIGSLFVSYYCWDLYFYQFCVVVLDLSISGSTYMLSIYNVGSCLFGFITGWLVIWTKRPKWIAFCAAPVYMLGTGLMIHFRQPGVNVGYVVMCQIFISFAGGTLAITQEIAGMAAGTHEQIAMILAILNLSSSVGGAIGDSIAGAIWTNVYPKALTEYLPMEAQANLTDIYLDYTLALEWPVGDPIRTGIQLATGHAQRDMCIAGTCLVAITFGAVWLWRDIHLGSRKQLKGVVI